MIEVYSLSIITPVTGVSVAWLGHGLSIEHLINSINSIAQHFVFSPVRPPEYKIVAICGVRSIEQCFLPKN
ncbi:hypothetical protein [Microcoleus vaginatus]|uniref:hypothetical protein n=1 Tax=Microcoleus vaginatus TaxID=119532 RepID=UPI0016883E9C|nr:hypothetical protein [Microcoleus sp. FACHB-84]MBD2008938.1 hypothetical protein [Microcoleus sp. FACHB-45]